MTKNGADSGKRPGAAMKCLLESFLAQRPLLSRFISRIVRPDDIEDIVQETFIQSYAAARQQHIANPQAFLLRTARNLALNHMGRADKKHHYPIEDLLGENDPLVTASVEDDFESREWFLIFCRSVAQLPVQCRKVFILKKVYGLSQREIAEFLDISHSTVEKHIAKGMLATTQYMKERGYTIGEFNGRRAGPSRPAEQGANS